MSGAAVSADTRVGPPEFRRGRRLRIPRMPRLPQRRFDHTCPDGTKRATAVSVQLLRLRRDLRTGSIPPANSAAAEVACLRKQHFWCCLIYELPMVRTSAAALEAAAGGPSRPPPRTLRGGVSEKGVYIYIYICLYLSLYISIYIYIYVYR